MNKWLVQAKVITRLDQIGIAFKVNKVIDLKTPVSGYKRLIIDVAILDKDKVLSAFYIGPRKERRIQKYKLLKVPVYFIHQDFELAGIMEKFMTEYTQTLFK